MYAHSIDKETTENDGDEDKQTRERREKRVERWFGVEHGRRIF